MPYSTRTRDRILRRPIAEQNTIPDADLWRQQALTVEEMDELQRRADEQLAADYERYMKPGVDAFNRRVLYGKRPKDWTDEDISELSYDMMSDDYAPRDYDRSYEEYMPSRGKQDMRSVHDFQRTAADIRRGTYRPTDEFGEPYRGGRSMNARELAAMRYYDMMQPQSIGPREYPSKAEAFLFGYDPVPEDVDFTDPRELAYMIPGVGDALYGLNVAERVQRGGTPGALEAAMSVPIAGSILRRAPRYAKTFTRSMRDAEARKFANLRAAAMERSNALPAPKIRMQNARTGRWDEVNAYPEFVPYEEVRF